MAYQAIGQAIRLESKTHLVNSLENRKMMLETEAPNTLRIPISLVRCSVENEAKPNKPNEAITIASIEK